MKQFYNFLIESDLPIVLLCLSGEIQRRERSITERLLTFLMISEYSKFEVEFYLYRKDYLERVKDNE